MERPRTPRNAATSEESEESEGWEEKGESPRRERLPKNDDRGADRGGARSFGRRRQARRDSPRRATPARNTRLPPSNNMLAGSGTSATRRGATDEEVETTIGVLLAAVVCVAETESAMRPSSPDGPLWLSVRVIAAAATLTPATMINAYRTCFINIWPTSSSVPTSCGVATTHYDQSHSKDHTASNWCVRAGRK